MVIVGPLVGKRNALRQYFRKTSGAGFGVTAFT
jgi:hypothetical protein